MQASNPEEWRSPRVSAAHNWMMWLVQCLQQAAASGELCLERAWLLQLCDSQVTQRPDQPNLCFRQNAVWAAQLFKKAMQSHAGVPLCLAEAPLEFAAADAWADENSAGIGGWWCPSGCAATPSSARWFSIQFERADLPTWFCSSESSSWQACISAFEALAQLVLLCLRCQFGDRHGSLVLKLAQLCDNFGVTYSTFKMLSMKQPLCFVLQALGFHCCRQGVALSCRHIAGCRNEWADSLSHNIII